MKVEEIVIPDAHPQLNDFIEQIQNILNNGRYQFRILDTVPTYATHEGEAAFYASGTERRFYGYINGVWCNFKFDETTGESIANAIYDADGDTGVQTEKNADEDKIRIGTGGTERALFSGTYTETYINFNKHSDLDNDTFIQVEEGDDEDKIRMDTGGTERILIDSNGIDVKSHKILNLVDPTADQHAATKKYVDDGGGSLWEVDGTEHQLKTADEIDMQSKNIINLLDPVNMQDAATMAYVVVMDLWETSGGDAELKTADDIDVQNMQLKGMRLENRTGDTGCTQNGRIWFRTDI